LLKLHLGLIDSLQQALATVDADVGKTLAPIEQCARLLTTMPGVSELTAHVLLAEIGVDMAALSHCRALAVLGDEVSQK
jgi:transposase